MQSLGTMNCTRLLAVPAAALFLCVARDAHAQTEATPPMVPAPAPVASATPSSDVAPVPDVGDQEHDRYCETYWLAMSRCRADKWTGPRLMLGVDFGYGKMNESGPFGFRNGIGSITDGGVAWGLSVGAELLPWLAVEGRYVGASNGAHAEASTGGSVSLLTTGFDAVLRLTAPLPYVHPYIFGGVGYYDISLHGSAQAKGESVLYSSSQPAIPMGVGVDVPLTRHLSIGAEATYHFQIGEAFSNVTTNGIDGGDLSTFNAVLRARL